MTNLTQAQKIEIIVANNGEDAGIDAMWEKTKDVILGIVKKCITADPVKIAPNITEVVRTETQADMPSHVIEFGVIMTCSLKAAVVAQKIVQNCLEKARPKISDSDMSDFFAVLLSEGDPHDAATPLEERSQSILKVAELTRDYGSEVYQRSVHFLEASAQSDMDFRLLLAALFDLIVDVEYEKLQLPATHVNASPLLA